MKSYENFVILSDMDGTLIGSDKKVSEKNKAAIRYFTEHGGSFGVATGRTQKNCAPYMKGLAINMPCIFYNGGALFDWRRQQFLESSYLEVSERAAFVRRCMETYADLCVQIYTEEHLYVVTPPACDDEVMKRERQTFEHCSLEEAARLPWIKILLCGRRPELLQCRELSERCGMKDKTANFFSSPFYLEFVGREVSKGRMLSKLQELPSYQGKKFIAAGDFHNDIEMLRQADWGVAPENAEPEVKEAADMIDVSCDDDLLDSIIHRIIPERFGIGR